MIGQRSRKDFPHIKDLNHLQSILPPHFTFSLCLFLSLPPPSPPPLEPACAFSACIFSPNKYFICLTTVSHFAEFFSPKGQVPGTYGQAPDPCGLVVRVQHSHPTATRTRAAFSIPFYLSLLPPSLPLHPAFLSS